MARGGGYSFSQVPIADIPRSTFNRSHGHKTTFDSGLLIPFYVDEALPGDTFQVRASLFARLATPFAPIMDNVYIDVFFFYVPNRLVWDNWQRFMGEQPNPGDSTDFVVPQVNSALGFQLGSLFDYFGLPLNVPNMFVCAFHSRAYNLIWNEWFRDENLQDRVDQVKGDGPDSDSNFRLLPRGKRKDYFTSCLPWPQKGDSVNIPLGTYAPIIPDSGTGYGDGTVRMQPTGGNPVQVVAGNAADNWVLAANGGQPTTQSVLNWTTETGLVAELSNATGATINSLRQAFQIQKLLERDARGGTRYTEILRSHFGVVSPDARLQRPEFLGGGTVNVNVNAVAQTSASGAYADTPQGNLAAFMTAAGGGIGFSKSFVEHGVILGLLSARADLSYQDGCPRMFRRVSRYDYYWPAFAHLGEQAVYDEEIFCDAATFNSKTVFGYQERWAEYRYAPSKITGKFRSGIAGGSLDFWHLAQDFLTKPVLDAAFIEDKPPLSRVLAVTDEPQFLMDSHLSIKCTRPMPTYSVPGLIDHF